MFYLQVLLWLDDIGIPQYRESMAENMIDGQMLTLLTAQDLIEVNLTARQALKYHLFGCK